MIMPVKTKKDYETALQRCYDLMQKNIKPNTSDADELEILSILIENYEQKHYPVPPPNPVDAIKYRLQQTGTDEKELNKILGGRSRKSEILSGKRKLSLNMIRELHDKLNIPAEILIAEY
ncbi:MAG: transcriptional regulator [Ginsengibacter sp.]